MSKSFMPRAISASRAGASASILASMAASAHDGNGAPASSKATAVRPATLE